jgi:predicted lipoprotein with Yx(FWY)xxD motif
MKHRPFLIISIAATLALAACGSDDDTGTPTTGPPATTSVAAAPATDAAAAPSDVDVAIATNPSLGDHLVDGNGRTLYLFERDQGTTTACTGGCADNWPPIIADGTPTAGDGVDATQLGTADGIAPDQITYHGHLLYYFAGDQAPGDTNGIGIPDWYAVAPDGEAIEAG